MAGPGSLYVVATPIGNLDDLSKRAIDTLSSVDLIAAEDTRVTRRLLSRASVSAKLVSYRNENERRLAPRLVASLLEGDSIALVSDAGTPAISDPGYHLVRAAVEAGIEVVSVPGPSAVTSLLSVSGLPTDRFAFEGFLSSSAGARRRSLETMKGAGSTFVIYESPRRVVRLLGEIAELLDDPAVAAGRELTKLHEEVLRGRASEVAAELEERGTRGEFVIAVHCPAGRSVPDDAEVSRELETLLADGTSVKDAAALLKPRGVSRRKVYELARKLDGE